MSEQEFNPERDKRAQEKKLEEKLSSTHELSVSIHFVDFLMENHGSAFTIAALSNRLEDIIKDTDELDYAKENLQIILNKMRNDGMIDTIEKYGEVLFLIEETEERSLEAQKINGELIKKAEKKEGFKYAQGMREKVDKKYREEKEEQGKIAQEKDFREKLANYLGEKKGSAFTIRALSNRLEEFIKDTDELDYTKENLQIILNEMRNNGIIDTVEQDGETHYLIKETEERSLEEQKINLEPVKQWLYDNRVQIAKWLLILGLLIGFMMPVIPLQINPSELLIALGVIFVTVSVLVEIIAISKQSKHNLKYNPPIFGIVTLVCDVIGLIILNSFTNIYYAGFGNFEMLYAIPFFIIALICGAAGVYFDKDIRPVAAILGLFLGSILFMRSLWPLFYYLFGFVAIFYH